MVLAIFLPIVLAAALVIDKIRQEEHRAALRGLHESARATSLIVDREIQGALSALEVLGNSPHLDARDMKAFYLEAQAIDTPEVWTVLLDATGQQIVNTLVPYGTILPPRGAQAQTRTEQVLLSQKPMVVGLASGPLTGRLLTSVHVPAKAAGGKSFVVARSFSVDHWKKSALQAGLPEGWILAVLDGAGKFIYRSHQTDERLGTAARPELVAAAAASHDGLIRHSTLEGIDAYDAFTHSRLTGWTVAIAAPVELIDAPGNRAVGTALGGVSLALMAAALIALAFGRRFIDALKSAGSGALALGRGESLRANKSHIVEVEELNQNLVIASGLQQAEREQRVALEAERLILLQKEITARETAQAQNIAKDQFIAMLGHELRNPLAAISGAVALMDLGVQDTQRGGRTLDIIRRQSGHLGRIVDDLLDVSRLMAGKIKLSLAPLDLAAAVNSCVGAVQSTARAAEHSIVVRTESVWILGDAVRIEQILTNLISNAMKFSPPGKPIVVTVSQEDGRAVVNVRDEGVGMEADLLQRIFEPFVQGPPAVDRLQSGLGIGLALVKQLVELHAGAVVASSDGPRQGSSFTLWIPSISAPSTQTPAVTAGGVQVARRLVYVEDNTDARETMAELLRNIGYEIIDVARGEEVLNHVLSARPDAVILDIGLPDIDGYEVVRRIRANPDSRYVPVIALTGYGKLRDMNETSAAGFDAHLVKPTDIGELTRTLDYLIASNAAN